MMMPFELTPQLLSDWVQTNVFASREMAAFGFAIGFGLAIWLLLSLLKLIGAVVVRIQNRIVASALKKDDQPGYRVLIANPSGRKRRAFGRRLLTAIENHLPTFSFGAPFRLARTAALPRGLSPKTLRKARSQMHRADADMIIWGERTGKGLADFVIYGLSRGGGLRPDEARLFNVECSGNLEDWTRAKETAVVYQLAKKLQPDLSNPAGFRPEKMKTLSSALADILETDASLTPGARMLIESDFCASAVHIAEESADTELLERVISLRRNHISDPLVQDDPRRLLQARIDLGRALLAQAEKNYDAAILEEAIGHLSHAVEALRHDPAIIRAQAASDAMFKAQTMIENQQRFSLNFGS
jgi:hypothetical protein